MAIQKACDHGLSSSEKYDSYDNTSCLESLAIYSLHCAAISTQHNNVIRTLGNLRSDVYTRNLGIRFGCFTFNLKRTFLAIIVL